jgi:iduronate 2-sulfatase
MAGLEIPATLQGSSLKPLLEKPALVWKSAAYSQFLLGRFPRGSQPEKMGYTIRTDRYRYVEWYTWVDDQKGELLARELFDHNADPQENVNIADAVGSEKTVAELSAQMKKGWRATRGGNK